MHKSIKFQENIALADFTTIKLGSSRARYFYELTDQADLPLIHRFAVEKQLPIRILGGGSNSLATDTDFPGIVIHNQLKGIEKEVGAAIYHVASGETWDDFVALSTEAGFSGIECTSGIPGSVGAVPVQNAGAYGQEVVSSMIEFQAYDFIDNHFVTIKTGDLEFAYRTSILKTHSVNRYFITRVSFKLSTDRLKRPLYWSLEKYYTEQQIEDLSPKTIRQAVLAIRAERVPDYKLAPSAGSFFENAEISPEKFAQLQQDYPDLPYGQVQPSGKVKIPTAWLIEKVGLAGQIINGIEITTKSPMILVNRSAKSFQDLMQVKQKIVQAIQDQFAIEIEQEPIIIA